ncbi:MAG TPA: FAD-dependent oxidoreductase [Pyrinomonadaceae bacterium]|nr:FAD-dependent oxidoreductase [Pyrinomonadaceae bacterium]
MRYEVVVVGAGVGGLTTAALLAARGVSVCVLEKEARAGGCATPFAHGGYEFEPGAGLYACWQPDEIHARVFAELPVAPPEARRLEPAYVVRLPDMMDVRVGGASVEEFAATLRAAFPECADAAVAFYRELAPLADALRRSARRVPALASMTKLQRMKLLASEARLASSLRALEADTTSAHLTNTSPRFRRFIDAQLQLCTQTTSESCAYLFAAVALTEPLRGLYELRGGAAALTDALAAAIKQCGGTIRFDTTALRLAYDSSGRAIGVDLLSGERIEATRAIVSNLTVWDTYGKLVGLKHTPPDVRARLRDAHAWGAYLIFAELDARARARLPAARILALTDWQAGQIYDPTSAQLMFNAADEAAAQTDRRAVTISTFTEAAQWFAYHEDESGHEAQDQEMLEMCWARLHAALPELGDQIEVIETATPRTYYEQTRRKLGLIGSIGRTPASFTAYAFTHRTTLQNLYMVGDTVFPGASLAAVTHSALIVANEIAPKR